MRNLRIGEAAAELGISARTIRYYEQVGLIPPLERRESYDPGHAYRQLDEEDLRRLGFIREARDLGLSIKQIKEVLNGENPRRLVAQALRQKALETKTQIERLRRLEGSLVRLVEVVESRESAQDCACERGFCGCTIGL